MKQLQTLSIALLAFIILNGCRTSKPTSDSAELFEGTITFENSIVSKKLSDSDQNYYNLFGNLKTLTYARGSFTNDFPNGQQYIRTLYNNKSNNYYMYYTSGEVKFFNCSSESDEIVEIVKSNELIEICGYQCKSIKLDFGRFSMTYFYSEQLPVDPTLLELHQYRHFNTLFEQTKSMYLRSIMEHKDMKFISTAIEVKAQKISEKIFEEPTNAIKF